MAIRTDVHTELLLAARSAHVRRDWPASYEMFARAGENAPLTTDDLAAMAVAAWQLGRGKESVRAAERVFAQLARTDPAQAAMKAVELGLAWFTRGDVNIAQGWMNRARRLLEGAPECATHGYLAYLDALVSAITGDATSELARRVQVLRQLGERLDAPAVTALCRVAEALEAIVDARMADAYGLIDEAMLPVLADQVPIDWAGDICCVVLNQCYRLADLPRMRAWTQSMQRWCTDFAGSANYGGVCDIHRLQLSAAAGDYRSLEDRLFGVSRALEDVNSRVAGEGYYQLGEVRRRRGDVDGAFAAFAQARALGIEPQPGEALLRCGRGDRDTAWTDLRVALATDDRVGRIGLLLAAVRVALARDDLDEAERYCGELESGAETFDTPGFWAWAAHARGARRCGGAATPRRSARCRPRCANTAPSSPATRPPRSTSGWPWRTGDLVTSPPPSPMPRPRRTSITSSVWSPARCAARRCPAASPGARSTFSDGSPTAPPTGTSPTRSGSVRRRSVDTWPTSTQSSASRPAPRPRPGHTRTVWRSYNAAEAETLRRAMGSKRSPKRMAQLRERFFDGMRDLHGITGDTVDRIYEMVAAFANFGFPESYSQSFASLVFYSAWFKLHHPAAFCAALLRAHRWDPTRRSHSPPTSAGMA